MMGKVLIKLLHVKLIWFTVAEVRIRDSRVRLLQRFLNKFFTTGQHVDVQTPFKDLLHSEMCFSHVSVKLCPRCFYIPPLKGATSVNFP